MQTFKLLTHLLLSLTTVTLNPNEFLSFVIYIYIYIYACMILRTLWLFVFFFPFMTHGSYIFIKANLFHYNHICMSHYLFLAERDQIAHGRLELTNFFYPFLTKPSHNLAKKKKKKKVKGHIHLSLALVLFGLQSHFSTQILVFLHP